MKEPQKDHEHSLLVDQALEHPVKYTLMLTKEIFSLNKGLFLGITAIVIVLSLFTNIPIIGLIASVLSGILMFSLFFFTGKVFYESRTMDEFVEKIRSTTIASLWKEYWKPSLGAYLGWVMIILFFILVTGIFIGLSGNSDTILRGEPEAILSVLPSMIVPFLLMGLILYVMPLVFANIIRTDNFNDAFKAVFSIFDKTVWKRAFTKPYFKYMVALGLVITGLMVAVMLLSAVIMGIFAAIDPSLMVVGMLITMIVMVLLQVIINVFFAISSVIADRITQHSENH